MKAIKQNKLNIKQISHPARTYVIHEQKYPKEAPPGIRIKASYMVEAAVVLPVFASFMLFLLFFFRILQVQQMVGSALIDSSRKLAIAAGVKSQEKDSLWNNAADLGAAEIIFRKTIKGEEVLSFISGGAGGIHLTTSDFNGDYITLRADYAIRIPIGILKVREVAVHQCAKSRKWTGQSIKDASNSDQMVYITRNGTVYHRSRECKYLKPSIRKITWADMEGLRNMDGAKYYSCAMCLKNKNPYLFVYITDYGNRYHNALSCSELERIIYMIRMSDAGMRHACSKCGKE